MDNTYNRNRKTLFPLFTSVKKKCFRIRALGKESFPSHKGYPAPDNKYTKAFKDLYFPLSEPTITDLLDKN